MCLRPRGEADKCSFAATLHYDTTYDLTSEFRGNAPKLCGNKQRGEFSPKLGFSPDISYDSSRGGLSHFLARHVRLATGGVFLTRRGLLAEA